MRTTSVLQGAALILSGFSQHFGYWIPFLELMTLFCHVTLLVQEFTNNKQVLDVQMLAL